MAPLETPAGPMPAGETDPDAHVRLVLAAIRLFAECGARGVGLWTAGAAAGLPDATAVRRHFGDRDALLAAALDRTLAAIREPVDHAHARSLGLAVPEPRSPLHASVGLAFLPILTLPLRHPDWGSAGARLLARVVLGETADLARRFEAETAGDAARLAALFRPHLRHLPAASLKALIGFATVSVVCGLAAAAYVTAVTAPGRGAAAAAALAGPLLDYVAAGLSANAAAAAPAGRHGLPGLLADP